MILQSEILQCAEKEGVSPDSLRWQTSIKIEIIFYEQVVNNPVKLPLYSRYSDKNSFEGICIPCYIIPEILAEKFRALLQRSYPALRDYYDLWRLLQQSKLIDWETITATFKQKVAFKDVPFNNYEDFFEESRLKKMKKEWNNSLQSHLKEDMLPSVDHVLATLKEMCSQVNWS